jgi:signal transduction histidine kinase
MEESNIRWGELVGGLLIVCCSVALVISFWENIASRPWLKFSIFTGINIATFSLGLYAWHRWKLPTTSKGILVIGMMLLPLNFLAFALFTLGMPWDWFTVGGEMISLAILGYELGKQRRY